MKVLLCHNYYQQRGGEDLQIDDETRLLVSHGHEVLRYARHNDEVKQMSRLSVARDTLWSRQSYREVRALLRRERPALMHCTNTFPLISPAVYYAARAEGVPVVQGLHNYRLLCPNAQFLRDGKVCESCLGKTIPWPAVQHGCYRGSRSASAVVAGMLTLHRLKKTWSRTVTRFYATSAFTRQKFVEAGMSPNIIDVKGNFVEPDPGFGQGQGGYAVCVGRLSPEKGVNVLVDAWSRLSEPLPLKIVGDGPSREQLQRAAANDPRIEFLGSRTSQEVMDIVGGASFLVIPSIWYEPFGRTIIEAFARGTPVIGSRIGAISELLADGQTGFLFRHGDADDLAEKVRQMLRIPSLDEMRLAARREYLAKYTSESNYHDLIRIYERALGQDVSRSESAPVLAGATAEHVAYEPAAH
ncbi:MAG: glycosyltransferase [Planctomycetia bacterium]|nr:glycosyltransferase [Planctomycetia bacterium]